MLCKDKNRIHTSDLLAEKTIQIQDASGLNWNASYERTICTFPAAESVPSVIETKES